MLARDKSLRQGLELFVIGRIVAELLHTIVQPTALRLVRYIGVVINLGT